MSGKRKDNVIDLVSILKELNIEEDDAVFVNDKDSNLTVLEEFNEDEQSAVGLLSNPNPDKFVLLTYNDVVKDLEFITNEENVPQLLYSLERIKQILLNHTNTV